MESVFCYVKYKIGWETFTSNIYELNDGSFEETIKFGGKYKYMNW